MTPSTQLFYLGHHRFAGLKYRLFGWSLDHQHIPNIRRAQLLPQFMIELFLPLRDRAELRQIRFPYRRMRPQQRGAGKENGNRHDGFIRDARCSVDAYPAQAYFGTKPSGTNKGESNG